MAAVWPRTNRGSFDGSGKKNQNRGLSSQRNIRFSPVTNISDKQKHGSADARNSATGRAGARFPAPGNDCFHRHIRWRHGDTVTDGRTTSAAAGTARPIDTARRRSRFFHAPSPLTVGGAVKHVVRIHTHTHIHISRPRRHLMAGVRLFVLARTYVTDSVSVMVAEARSGK